MAETVIEKVHSFLTDPYYGVPEIPQPPWMPLGLINYYDVSAPTQAGLTEGNALVPTANDEVARVPNVRGYKIERINHVFGIDMRRFSNNDLFLKDLAVYMETFTEWLRRENARKKLPQTHPDYNPKFPRMSDTDYEEMVVSDNGRILVIPNTDMSVFRITLRFGYEKIYS